MHKLSNIDIEKKTAICSIDGEVSVGVAGRRWRCRTLTNETSRVGRYRRKYGIDIKNTEIKPCQLCGGTTKIAYDHSHKTGEFRGWLCMKCNTALGLVNDDIILLKKMIIYLEK
jgi:hypothetical protein